MQGFRSPKPVTFCSNCTSENLGDASLLRSPVRTAPVAAGGSRSLETTMATPEQSIPETHVRLADFLRTKPFSLARGDAELSSVALAAAKSTFDSGSPKKLISLPCLIH